MSPDEPQLKQELEQLRDFMLQTQKQHSYLLEKVHPSQYLSAINLLHYLALRSIDIRPLQDALHQLGLSSLMNAESHIYSQMLLVLKHFNTNSDEYPLTYTNSKILLQQRSNFLFGNTASVPAIMVTLKTSHASDTLAVVKLLKAGMQIARINCAHDDEKTWLQMVQKIQLAMELTALPCKIYMDLAGPKVRTKIKGKKCRIRLHSGDHFYLSDEKIPPDDLPVVACTITGMASQLKPGERVFFDDGVIETKVFAIENNTARLEVVRLPDEKTFLKEAKGINFPDSHFSLSAFTGFDRECLPFILKYADMVGYSFIHNTTDLVELQAGMKEKNLPIILKIETPEAFKNFPALLFKAMEQEYFGVMIARGDLAVELGFERMSEVQEEICWICEAAHAPVIWATQVLETMNKKGIATRSEITDAFYSHMAECIMINKGAHTVQVIKALRNILDRSGGHHLKKRYLFRPLNVARNFLTGKNNRFL
ncbi:MAG TPA: pyruvate kinase [Chitinophagaceae bacterium]